MSAFSRGRKILDDVQHLAQLEAFDPAAFFAAISDEAAPAGASLSDLGAHLDAVRGLLAEIDRFAQKSMRIRLLQSPDALPQQLRTLLHSTIVSYQRDAALLRQRVAAALARLDRSADAAMTNRVMEAAERVLAARAALRQGVMELARSTAAAALPAAQRAARDRTLPDDERERWGRARADLEHLAANGETIDTGSFDERLQRVTPSADEPDEPSDPTATRFSLLELD